MSGAAICDAALKVVEESRKSYLKKYNQWVTDVRNLTLQKDIALSEYQKADAALADTPTNATEIQSSRGTFAVGPNNECDHWSSSDCHNRCNWRTLTTPLGKKSKWDYRRPQPRHCLTMWRCECDFVNSWNTSDVTEKKTKYENLENQLRNRIGQEPKYKDENPPTVQCCSNDIDCGGGVCHGSIQSCKIIIDNLNKKEDEDKVMVGIRDMQTLFNGLITKFNNYKSTFENYNRSFNNINFNQKNINLIYNQIKSAYDNTTAIFNQIEKNVENILIFNNSLLTNNSKIGALSSYKEESNTILNNSNSKRQQILDEYKDIVELYVKIYKVNEDLERDTQNYNSMIVKKSIIDETVNNFNNNIDSINNIYTEIKSLILFSEDDLQRLLELNNKVIDTNNQITNLKNLLSTKFEEIKVLFNTISPRSIYYNTAYEIFVASENTFKLINTKFNEIQEIINDINNNSKTKKKDYESQKKINEDTKQLYALEQEENKRNSDILLLKIIEEEEKNKLSKIKSIPINITDNVSSSIIIDKTQKIDYTIYIIIGVIVILFLIFLFMKN
jgi:hypothetical protein